MPLRTLFTIFFALIALTLATVLIAQLDLGSLEIGIAMFIATIKAALVVVYFMHLRYDNPFNAVLFVFSLVFVALFIGLTLMDVGQYQIDLIP